MNQRAEEPKNDRIITWLVYGGSLVAGMALLTWGAAWIGNFIEDDTLISLRYSRRLLEGNGLTWTDGEWVEGYSNLAWVLLAAVMGAVGFDLIAAVRILSVASMLILFLSVARASRSLGTPFLASWATAAVLGASAPFWVWVMGALEQPLVAACLGVTVAALVALMAGLRESSAPPALSNTSVGRAARVMAAALSLLVLTRPDSPLFVAVFGISAAFSVYFVWGRGPALRIAGLVIGVPFATFVAQLCFRLGYYGEWVPNTAHIKIHVTPERFMEGLDYARRGLETLWLPAGFGIAGLFAALSSRTTRTPALTVFVAASLWLVYVVTIGGDHFPGYRQLVPAIVLLSFCGLFGLTALASTGKRATAPGRRLGYALALGTILVTPAFGLSQREDRTIDVARFVRWPWDGEAIGGAFKRAFEDRKPLWAVTAAGCMPYFSQLPALDLLGLNDATIARTSRNLRGPLAHDHGNGEYVLERAPDLITFGTPRGGRPVFKSGLEMAAMPEFQHSYQPVAFQALAPHVMKSLTYVRIQGRVGFRQTDEELTIPAYLLRGNVLAVPARDHTFMAELSPSEEAHFDLPRLASGTYSVRLERPNPLVEFRVRTSDATQIVHGRGPDGTSYLRLDSPTSLRFELRSPHLYTRVSDIQLRRASPPSTTNWAAPTDITRIQAPLSRSAIFAGPTEALFPQKGGFGDWTKTGNAWGDDWAEHSRPGQEAVLNQDGPFINSFRMLGEESGDTPVGILTSPALTPGKRSWLEFRVGGGDAIGILSQSGVRLMVDGRVWGAYSGRRSEYLRHHRVDLSPLAGKTIRVEIFDESTIKWGHVIADRFALHHIK